MARFLFYLLAAAAAVVSTVSPATLKRRHPMMVVPFSVPTDAEVLDLRTTEHKRADKLVSSTFTLSLQQIVTDRAYAGQASTWRSIHLQSDIL
jgi:hypothetical protein